MPRLERPDASLHYEVSGEGPPLMLIAGFMSDGASWAPLLPLLEQHFTVIRPDNRSTGQTTPWHAPCGLQVWAEDLDALLDHLNLGPAHIHGHSLGGMIAWTFAHQFPLRVQSLVISGAAPGFLARNLSLFQALIAVRKSDAPPDTWLRLLFHWLFAPQVYEDSKAVEATIAQSLSYPFAQSTEAMAHQLAALDMHRDGGLIPPPTVKMRALLGERDLILPVDVAQPRLSGTDIHVIPDAGHSLHWDAPDHVCRHILESAGVET